MWSVQSYLQSEMFLSNSVDMMKNLYWGRCRAILGPYWDHIWTIKGPSWDHPSLFLQADCAQSPTAKMAEVFFKVSSIFPKGSIVKMATFILWKVCSAVFWRFFFFVFYRQNARGSSTHWQLPKGNTRQKWQNLSERKRKSRRKTYACKEDFNWKWKDEKPSVGKLN